MSEILSDIDPVLERTFARLGARAQAILESLPWTEQLGVLGQRIFTAMIRRRQTQLPNFSLLALSVAEKRIFSVS